MRKTDKPVVSVIIVNRNGEKLLRGCLASLTRSSFTNIEVIFVDNASTDRSILIARRYIPSLKLIQNKKNLGFAAAHDAALTYVRGRYILLLNTDTQMERTALEYLVKTMSSQSNIAAVQPKLLLFETDRRIDSIGMFLTPSGMLYHYGREKDADLPKYNKLMDIYSAKGACLLLKKSVIRRIGLFDKDFFAYFEETDLCHRIWLAGYRVVYTPKAEVVHRGGGVSSQMMPSYIYFHAHKNRLCSYIKNFSLNKLLTLLPLTLIQYGLLMTVYVIRIDVSNARAVASAVFWNMRHIKSTLEKRRYVQTYVRKVPDSSFLSKLTKNVGVSYYIYFLRQDLRSYTDK